MPPGSGAGGQVQVGLDGVRKLLLVVRMMAMVMRVAVVEGGRVVSRLVHKHRAFRKREICVLQENTHTHTQS